MNISSKAVTEKEELNYLEQAINSHDQERLAKKIRQELADKKVNDLIVRKAEKSSKISHVKDRRGRVISEVKKVSKPG